MISESKMIYADTNVIVNSFFSEEKGAEISKILMKKIASGEFMAIRSKFTLLEISSVISRRTGDPKLVGEFVNKLKEYPNLKIVI